MSEKAHEAPPGKAGSGGRLALVTGAGTGIGRAVALGLARLGHNLMLVGRREAPLRRVEEEAGGALVLAEDVANDAGRRRVAAAVTGPLHVLVHSAGAFRYGGLAETQASDWAALDRINVHAPVLLTGLCLPALRAGGGDVVFVNSTAGLQPGSANLAYAAGKHALRSAVETLRRDLQGQGVRVLSVFPGRTETPMQEEVLAAEKRQAPPGTLIQADDVAAMVLAALSLPRRAEVTGIVMRPSRPL